MAPPSVAFSFTVSALTVTFKNLTKGANTWAWDFGDGATSTARNPVHPYAAGGTYAVTLTAVGSTGATASLEQAVTVAP